MHTAPATERLAEFVATCSLQSMPESVKEVAKHCLTDWLGCTLAASGDPLADMLVAEALDQGGKPVATVFGHNLRTNSVLASLVNGSLSHVLDFDDVHLAMSGHPSAPVIPSALAIGEEVNATGEQLLEALIVALEAECRIGVLMGPTHYGKGWNPSGTVGTIGAAAAAARLMQQTTEQTRQTFGLAATQAAGLQSMVRTQAMPFHSGRAASSGLLAARLVGRGMTAQRSVLECHQGFASTHSERPDFAACLDGLGERWLLLDILFKYHVSCYAAHPAIEATKALLQDTVIPPAKVRAISVEVSSFIRRLCVVDEPTNSIEQKFSIPQNIALTLLEKDTGRVDTFCDSNIADRELTDLRRKVSVHVVPSMADWETSVSVSLEDGAVVSRSVVLSEPNRMLDNQRSRLEEKFMSLAQPVVGLKSARAALDCVWFLEKQPAVSTLTAFCVAEKAGAH